MNRGADEEGNEGDGVTPCLERIVWHADSCVNVFVVCGGMMREGAIDAMRGRAATKEEKKAAGAS
jgi:hypothetical protein